MPETFTFEEASVPHDSEKFTFEEAAGKAPPTQLERMTRRYGPIKDRGEDKPGESVDPFGFADASRYNVSPKDVQDAMDYIGAQYATTSASMMGVPLTERDKQEIIGSRSQPPSTANQVAAGLQNVGVGIAGGMASPPGLLAGLTPPGAAQRLVSIGFALDMARHYPEQARAAGEASVNGSPYEKAATYGQMAVTPVFVTDLGYTGTKGLTQDIISQFRDYRAAPAAAPAAPAVPVEPVAFSEFGGEKDTTPAAAAEPKTFTFEEASKPAETFTFEEAAKPSERLDAPPVSPVAPEGTTIMANQRQFPVVEIPVKELSLSKDVPNFKADADPDTGVVQGQKLAGKYERLGTGAITVWERADGSKEVISGRHRFDLARRAKEETIPSQVVREADGFTKEMAMTLDAEMNIRDGQGGVADYANYFRNAGIAPEEAAARGLVARAKGKAGWAIGRQASDDVYALYRAGKINEGQTVAIATAAPGEPALQRVGSMAAIDGKSPQEISNFMQAVRLQTRNLPPEQFDLFAADDSALKEAERLASVASRIQNELSREIKATDNAAKAATTAKAKGIQFERPPEEILKENILLKGERDAWDNWALKPELVQQVRDYAEMQRKGKREYSLEKPGEEGKVPKDELRYTEEQLDRASEGLIAGIVSDRPEFADAGARRVTPDLLDPHTRARLGTREILEGFEKAFGIKLVFLAGKNRRPLPFSGVRDSRFPGVLFLDVNSPRPALTVAGHELMHDIKGQSPRLYEGVDRRLTELMQDFPVWQKRLNDLLQQHNEAPLQESAARTELIGDFVGEQMVNERFWQKLEARDPNLFVRLATSVRAFLTEIKDRLLGTARVPGMEATRFFKDVEMAQEVTAAALTAYARSKSMESGNATERSYSMEELPERQFGKKVRASEDISDATKARVSEYNYTPRNNESDLQTATRIIQERGLDNAITTFTNPPTAMPAAVQSALGKALILELSKQERLARVTGDNNLAEALVEKQAKLIDADLIRSTEVAQALQAMRLFGDLSPSAVVRYAENEMGNARKGVRDQVQPTVNAARSAMREANAEALNTTVLHKDVNAAARAAVNEQVINSPETHRGVVLELAEPFAQSPVILQHARTAVASKVNELLNKAPRPPGMNVSQHQRAIMNELASRAASIANGHYQGAEPSVPLKDKLMQRLGIGSEPALRLARQLDAEFARMVEQAKSKLSQRIAKQRARQEAGLPADPSETQLDQSLRQQLRKMNVKLGELVRQSADEVDAAGKSIGDRVVQASGLEGAKAEELRQKFDLQFKEAATAAKRRRLEAMESQLGKAPRKVREQYQKIIELTNLGAFNDATFDRILLSKLELPEITPEIKNEIIRRVNDMQAKPEGIQRQRSTLELMDYIAKLKGFKWHELPMAFWYANVLSSPLTHFVNTVSNAVNLTSNLGIQMVRRPLATPQLLEATARGFGKGALEAKSAWQTGYVTGTKLTKFEPSRPLELKKFTGWAAPFNAWKYVTRALAAEDLLFFKAAEELKSSLIARQIAKREGLTGSALQARVDDILGNVTERVDAAKTQAVNEGLTGLDFKRRVNEIIEQARPETLRENALDYALKVTFNNKPYGTLGMIASLINQWKIKQPAVGLVVPFTNIVANVTNESLNYFPVVGGTRAALATWGPWKGKLDGKIITDREVLYDQWAKVAIGSAMLSGLAIATAMNMDDEDPAFAVYGGGPRTKDQRNQLKQTGWIPNSVKMGNRYYSYANMPAAIPLAILGNYFDAIRYKDLNKTDAANRAAYALQEGGHVIVQNSFLDGLARVFSMLSGDSTKNAGTQMTDFASRTASSFVVPNALRWVDRVFDPTIYSADDVAAGLINQTPFVRSINKPTLNVFGEPVKADTTDRFTKGTTDDHLSKFLAAKRVWIPVQDRQDVIIGSKKNGEGHYRILTPDEWYQYMKESGAAIRKELEKREAAMRHMRPEAVKAMVQAIAERERAKVKARFKR